MSALLEMASRLDPVCFAESLGFTPDSWQAALLRSEAKRHLVLCARQSGKTSSAALVALHQAVYRPGSLILVLSPAQRQSLELVRAVRGFYRAMDGPPGLVAEGATHLELGNGSRVLALPGSEATVRGFSAVDVLIVDEAARVPDPLYLSVRPMLGVSGGRLLALSTPRGQRGWFYEQWRDEGSKWERTRITAYDCPRISRAFLDEEERALGCRWYQQEYLCSFESIEDAAFDALDILALPSDEVKPLPFWGGRLCT